jgi:hypothetical protein
MQITPTILKPGTIVVTGEVPSISVGRQLVATVLSNPQNGLILVSMFGRQFMVETNLDLKMGQVLNLKVFATSPKVILKPVEAGNEPKAILKALDNLVEQLAGKFGDTPIKSFDVREIIKKLISEPQQKDAAPLQFAQKLIEQFSQMPNAVAFLLVPFVDDESKGRAQVAIEREGDDYRINFQMETDSLGLLESTVLRSDQGLNVELRSGSEEIAQFLRSHVKDLFDSLEPFGVKRIEVVQKTLLPPHQSGVNVVV